MTVPEVEARKARNRQHLAVLARWCATVLALPAVVVALAVVLGTRNVLVGLLLGVVAYVAAAGLVFRHLRRFGAVYVDGLDGVEVAVDPDDPDDAAGGPVPPGTSLARLNNLIDGLCLAHGVARPRVVVLDVDAVNAATVAITDRPAEVVLVITRPLVDELSRIELEGLLAQQLSHVRDGDTALSTFVAALASLPLVGSLLGARAGGALDPHLETAADLAGAAMTRYPPGLAGALGRVADRSTAVPGVPPAAAHLWLADPLGASGREPFVPHPPVVDRVEVLHEL